MKKIIIFAWILVFFPFLTWAEQTEPLWEAGLGIAAVSFPAYRGSDKIQQYILPMPYFTYHGKILKADRQGLRASLLDNERLNFTLSMSASPPTKSDNVTVRANMPDLKPTFEFGPELDIKLWQNLNNTRTLNLRLPWRVAYTLESNPRSIGTVFSPNLNLDFRDLPGLNGWNVGLVVGPIFASQRQHQYFYGVSSEYATDDRPIYNAQAGYSGTQILISLSKNFDHIWLGAFLRYDNLNGAVFLDSPLVQKKDFFAAGVAFAWIFGASSTQVIINN